MKSKKPIPPRPNPEPNPDNEKHSPSSLGDEAFPPSLQDEDDDLFSSSLLEGDDDLLSPSLQDGDDNPFSPPLTDGDDGLFSPPLTDGDDGLFSPPQQEGEDNPFPRLPDGDDEPLPPPLPINYEYFDDRSYIFLFGPSNVGKTVIIGSIYEYLNTQRGAKYGDTLSNLNRNEVAYERHGSQLLNQFIERSIEKEFPDGTAVVSSFGIRIPKHLNFRFEPSHKKKPIFEFCFMDMAGEDLSKLDFDSDKPLPDSIKTYIEDVPQENLCFVYVIDPTENPNSKIEQIQLFNAFINLIDSNGHKETPILLIVSKWDMVDGYNEVEDYLKKEYAKIWGVINQDGRNFDFAEFSIGEVKGSTINRYDFSYPERVFNWIYKNQMGVDIIDSPKQEMFFTKLINKYFK